MLTSFYFCILYYCRIYLNYHTEDQVLAGSVLGTCFALFWYILTEGQHSLSLRSYCLQLSLLQWLLIRDYSRVEYAPVEEYSAMAIYVSDIQPLLTPSQVKKETMQFLPLAGADTHNRRENTTFTKPLGPGQFSRLRERHNTSMSSVVDRS